ncbi:MAG TPA: hypothetical protein VHU83_20460 [Bryobacteraceae bacterium]|nr:hypothetical protein [Bryobacteraceae bacterium]
MAQTESDRKSQPQKTFEASPPGIRNSVAIETAPATTQISYREPFEIFLVLEGPSGVELEYEIDDGDWKTLTPGFYTWTINHQLTLRVTVAPVKYRWILNPKAN